MAGQCQTVYQIIRDDNFFWLAPGEKRVVLIEKSPAAKLGLRKNTIPLLAACRVADFTRGGFWNRFAPR